MTGGAVCKGDKPRRAAEGFRYAPQSRELFLACTPLAACCGGDLEEVLVAQEC